MYALRLAELGADVVVADADLRSYEQFEAERERMTAESTAEEVRALGRRASELQFDVTDPRAVEEAVARIDREFGRLDIAICNAGGGTGTPEESRASIVDADLFDTVVKRNLYGTVNTCRAAVPLMKRHRYGRIVTVSSQAGRRGEEGGGYAHYGAAKAGIQMYTRYLAQDVGGYGITANCIAPGFIGTGRLNVMFEQAGADKIAAQTALKRIGTPEDCANVMQFLVTDLGSYVTGALIPVDGGSVR